MDKAEYKKQVEAFYSQFENKPVPVRKFTSKRKLKKYLSKLT